VHIPAVGGLKVWGDYFWMLIFCTAINIYYTYS
jgi:hypothetical protein